MGGGYASLKVSRTIRHVLAKVIAKCPTPSHYHHACGVTTEIAFVHDSHAQEAIHVLYRPKHSRDFLAL